MTGFRVGFSLIDLGEGFGGVGLLVVGCSVGLGVVGWLVGEGVGFKFRDISTHAAPLLPMTLINSPRELHADE